VENSEALRAWIVEHVAGVDDAPMETELISGGHSNVTIGVTVGERELVVRRPPTTAFLPTANDVGREYRFYSALAPFLSMRIPAMYAARYDDGDGSFVQLLEDLDATGCTVPDGRHGVTPDAAAIWGNWEKRIGEPFHGALSVATSGGNSVPSRRVRPLAQLDGDRPCERATTLYSSQPLSPPAFWRSVCINRQS